MSPPDPLSVVQVTPRYPPHSGGVETHVHRLSTWLADEGHDVTVVTGDADGDLPTRARQEGVKVLRHRGLAPDGAFHVAPGILRTVSRLEADVVHGHNYHSLPALFGVLTAGDAATVVTPHYHGGSESTLRDHLLRLYRPLGGWALGRADRVVAVSDWERDQLREDFGVAATVVPNGLDWDRFVGAAPEHRDRPYLLCVGRLVEYKGVQHAVRALEQLPEYDLVVAGAGPYRETLEDLAVDLGLSDRVEFLGFVDHDRLPGLYAGARVLCALSSFEAYGLTVQESLAAGTPCVVRPRGGLQQWVGRPGCVAAEDVSPGSVADAVRDTVERAVSRERLLSWGEMGERVFKVYRACLGHESRSFD